MIEKPALRRLFLPGDRLRSPPLADLRWLAKISYLPSPRSLFHRGQRVQFVRFRVPLNHCQAAVAGHRLNFKRRVEPRRGVIGHAGREHPRATLAAQFRLFADFSEIS